MERATASNESVAEDFGACGAGITRREKEKRTQAIPPLPRCDRLNREGNVGDSCSIIRRTRFHARKNPEIVRLSGRFSALGSCFGIRRIILCHIFGWFEPEIQRTTVTFPERHAVAQRHCRR